MKTPDRYASTVFRRSVGRLGVMVTRKYVGEQFGQLGSSGYTFTVSVWRNPDRSRVAA